MEQIKGLATGIGSLPYKEARPAVDLVFKAVPEIPFWPQLPKRDIREGMAAQFSQNLPCLELSSDGLFFNPRDKDKELEVFYDRLLSSDVDYFKITPDYASGFYEFYQRLEKLPKVELDKIKFIKCHITGPFTFAASLNDQDGRMLLYDEIFMQAFLKGLILKVIWQVNFFKKFGKKVIVFVDEPYLSCFGSAYSPLNKQQVVSGLAELAQGIKSCGAAVGVHCCGNTDWTIFTDVADIEIINFDVSFVERLALYANDFNTFLKRGGILCWGIIPTSEFSAKDTSEVLAEKIKIGFGLLVNKGVDRKLLEENILVSPACGLGTLEQQKAENIFTTLASLSKLIR